MKKNKIVLFMSMALVSVSLIGCGNKEEVSTDSTDKDYEINLGYYNCDHMIGAAVGEAAGIFKDMGLNVKLTGNGKVPEAMAAGKMDAGYIGNRGLIGANGKGSPIMIGANNHIGGSMYLVVANDIEKPEDLYGQKVALGDLKGEGWIAGYAKTLNLSTDEKDYELVTMGSDADKYLALTTGQIKAFTTCDPWGSMAEHEGTGKIMGTYMKMDDKMGICCAYSFNKKFVEEHPELASDLLVAHQESIKYVYENPYEAARIFSKYYKVPEEVSLMTIYKKCVSEGRTLVWEIEEESFKHAYSVYEKYDLIDPLPTFEDLIAYDVYDAAKLDDFGKYIEEKVDPIFPLGMSFEDFKAKAMEIDKESQK